MGELLAGLTGRKRPPERFAGWLHQASVATRFTLMLAVCRDTYSGWKMRLANADDRLTSDGAGC